MDDRADGRELLDDLAAAFKSFAGEGAGSEAVLEEARARARRLAAAAGSVEAPALAAVTFTADALAALWLEHRWTSEEIDSLLERASEVTGFPPTILRVAVFLGMPRNQHVLELPPRLAMEALLGMLLRFAPVSEASVWAVTPEGGVDCRLSLGGPASRRGREVARGAITHGASGSGRALLHGISVRRWGEAHAALVVRARPEDHEEALTYAAEVAVALGPLLETEALLERSAAREQSLVGAAERRLVRLGADIHDGPLQDLAALASDLRLFRTQVAGALADSADQEIVVGRVDDLEARLVALDGELRELSSSLASPGIMAVEFTELLRSDVASYEARTGVAVSLTISGKFDLLTASQRIALLRVIREALQNVHEHSGAREATVEVHEGRGHLRARIRDEGAGFDVERRLVEAARGGRLGLVGMGERIRLLGGRLDIDSRPGGPTVVTASIPRWQPPDANDASSGYRA